MVVDMKNMAKDLRIPVLLIAHLRKLSDTKPPTPNDIKDSVALSQVPDVTMILHREKRDPEDENNNNDLLKPRGKLYVYKNRVTGKTGTLNFSLLPTGEFVFDFG
jgi:replicative DNA helicase